MLALLTTRPNVRLSTDAKPAGVEKGGFVYFADTGESFYSDGNALIPLPLKTPVLDTAFAAILLELGKIRRGMEMFFNQQIPANDSEG